MDDRTAAKATHPGSTFPLAVFLGMSITDAEPGVAVARLDTGPAHRNPHGAVHGAVMFTMVDTAMGAATMSLLDDDHWCASIDIQLRFIKPVLSGGLEARAQVLYTGRRVTHLEAQVRDQHDELVALATGAFAVLPRPT